MASDIKNTSDGTTGVSRIGKSVVATGGGKYRVLDPGQPRVGNTNIASVTTKFDARFDEPRYYSGDTIS